MKTGTSAVQHFFRSHDNLSVIYPRVALWADGAHHNLVNNFYQDFRRPATVRSDWREMFAEIGRQAAAGGDLLISSEGLPGRDIGALVRELLPYLGEGPWQPEILIVFREHFSRAASLYNQVVKDGFTREQGDPDLFLSRENTHFYAAMVQRLRRFGIPLTGVNYHPSSSFLPRFLAQLGIADSEAANNELRNVSLSVPGLIATLAANNVAQTPEDRGRYFDAVGRMRRFYAPSEFIFGAAAAEAAEVAFREDRRFLADEFGIELPAPDLAAQKSQFRLDPAELQEIAEVTRDLGAAGEAIVAFARKYLHRAADGIEAMPQQAASKGAGGSRTPHASIPVFAYWDSADDSKIGRMLEDWRRHFPSFQVLGDRDVVALFERHFPQLVELYLALNLPAAKADVARLLALYEWGGLYVDCHYGIIDADRIRQLINQLDRYEAIFVDRAMPPRKPDNHWLVNGCMLGRPKSPLFLTMTLQVLTNLVRQRQAELETGFSPYNIFVLTGSDVVTGVVCEPRTDFRVVRHDMAERILIVPEEELPIERGRWRTYTIQGQQWHVRQQNEPLFAPPDRRSAPTVPLRGPPTARLDRWWQDWTRRTLQ
jgi:hypothetical protein